MAMSAAAMTACGPGKPQLGVATIDEVADAMTLKEKAHLVVGTGMDVHAGTQTGESPAHTPIPGAAGATYAIPRLGIPGIVMADGPAGLRINPMREGDTATYYCTQFPVATALASTWNTDLVEQVGQAVGNEALEYGIDVLLAPAMNIQRNPLCGRNFEYYSEDPVVTGKMAAAYVRGVQGNGVCATLKHFAVNNQESNRMANDARVSQRALREIYLKGFEIALKEGKPWAVMTSYNKVNGTYASESVGLLTTLLRDEWKFKGTVMSGWFGGRNAVLQMEAGNDMLQPGTDGQYETILKAVKDKKLDEAKLDRNVRHVLEMLLRSPRLQKYKYTDSPDLNAHAAIARRSAEEGMVLLKNDSMALPLDSAVRKVALFGCASYALVPGGSGSGTVNSLHTVSLLEGLENAGYAVSDSLKALYLPYLAAGQSKGRLKTLAGSVPEYDTQRLPRELQPAMAMLEAEADSTDMALLTISRTSGESEDLDITDFFLRREETQLLDSVCKAFHAVGKKVVVVLNVGGVIETASWKDKPDAILCAWLPGQEGGNSLANVLAGKSVPSGKLPVSFPLHYEDVPSASNFPINAMQRSTPGGKKDWDYTNYEEDIYVGYRYYDSFGYEVSYPFGHGLSYTAFEYSEPTIVADGDKYTLAVKVKNAGHMPGKEVVQLYVSAPQAGRHNKPEKELKAFAKTDMLQPGQTAEVKMEVRAIDLASFNSQTSSWEVDGGGSHTFWFGASSDDIRDSLRYDVPPLQVKVGDVLKPQTMMRLLHR